VGIVTGNFLFEKQALMGLFKVIGIQTHFQVICFPIKVIEFIFVIFSVGETEPVKTSKNGSHEPDLSRGSRSRSR
jgi:hypothetical protein